MWGFDPWPWALAGAIGLLSLPVHADEKFAEEPSSQPAPAAAVDEAIVVTAHRSESPADAVGSSVTVLDAETLAIHAFASVGEALRMVPGLDISRTGGLGQVTSVFTRGGSTSQTLVLLDGVRLNSSTTGAFDFGDLGLEEVERIEVVRGPQSTLYGSEAAAGVIQVITKRGAGGLRVHGLGELGDGDFHHARLGVSGSTERFDGRLAGDDLAIDAVSAADRRRGNVEKDGHEATSFSGRFGVALGDGETSRIDLRAHRFESETELDGFAFPQGPVDDPDALLERRATYAGATWRGAFGSRWQQSLDVGLADDDIVGSDPTDPFGAYRIDSRTSMIATQAEVAAGDRQVFSFGLEREERRGGSVGAFDEEVEVDAAWLQDRWRPRDDLTLTLGVRHDDHSSFGGETTGRVALAWQLTAPLRLHASWGTGFKAPTLNDLFYPFFSNPDLQPEESRAFDVGLDAEWLGGRARFDVTYFDLSFDNLIAFDFATFLPQNVAAAESRGVEAAWRWRSEGDAWSAGLAHTWNDTEDEDTGLRLARRPEHRSVLDLAWRPAPSWRFAAVGIAVSDRIDSDGAPLEDYERLDLAASWLGHTRFEPSLRVLNVFDDDRSEVGGYSAQPRTVIAGLGVEF